VESICAYVSIRQHASAYAYAYVSMRRAQEDARGIAPRIRQHTSACVERRKMRVESLYTQTSAYVSIRQHTQTSACGEQCRRAPEDARALRQYLYFCTSKASNLSIRRAVPSSAGRCACNRSAHTSAYTSIRQHASSAGRCACNRSAHTSAYASIRQHTSAYVERRTMRVQPLCAQRSVQTHTSAYVSIRQHTPTYVSIRSCTSEAWRSASSFVRICTFVPVSK
jgi:hypothetical protein